MSGKATARQFVLFLVAGGLAATVNIGSRLLLDNWLAYLPSILVAHVLGMGTAFALNRQFVFDGAHNRFHHQVFWFASINVAAALQTIVVSVLLARWLLPIVHIEFHQETLAHIAGVLVPVVTSYIGHKHLSFATARPTPDTNGRRC